MKSYEEMLNYVENFLNDHNAIRHTNPALSFRNRFWHINRVYNWTKILAADYPDCDLNALYTAAIFHDIGYANGKCDHATSGALIFEQYAKSEGFDEDFTAYVSYLIKFHSAKELLKKPDTPIEIILLQEADLLDEEGAMGVVFDILAYTKRYPDTSTFYGALDEMYKHSAHILDQEFMVTPLAKKYWKKKQDFVRTFLEEYSNDLFVKE